MYEMRVYIVIASVLANIAGYGLTMLLQGQQEFNVL